MPRALWRAVIVLGLTWCATSAYALDPSWAMSQYIRHRWGSDRGFGGGPVYAIAQTGDGYLWIASEKGLVRFDGLTFRLFEPPGLTSSSSPAVLGVVAAPDGSLWARLRGPALVRYRGGAFEDLLGVLDLPDNVVTALLRSNDGAVLVSSLGFGVIAYRPGQRVTVITRDAMPGSAFPISMAQANDGAIWLGTRDAGVLGIRGAEVTRITAGLPDLKINCLLPGENGTLWIGTDRGVVRWTGREVTTAGVPAPLKSLPALAMIQDRQSNIWIAAGPRGLYRMSHGVVSTLERHDRDAHTSVTTVFEDRDGSLWVGTDRGIEQWRDAVFATYTVAQGMPTDAIGPVFADAADRTWFAPIDGGLYWMRSGAIHKVDAPGLNDDVVYSIAGSGDELWLGRQRGGLTRLDAARGVIAEQFTQVSGLTQNSVYAVHRARDGAIWAGTLSGGVSRHKGGAFTNHGVADGLASNTVASIAETADGTMWFATPNGVSTLSRGGWRRYAVGDGLPSNDVSVLFGDTRGRMWAGTAAGLAVLVGGQVTALPRLPLELRKSILGIAEDRDGRLWVSTVDGVLSVDREALLRGVLQDADVRSYGAADGLVALEGVKRHRSLVSDPLGRIWLSTASGLAMADPSQANTLRPPVHVEQIVADRQTYSVPSENGDSLRLPPLVRDLQIDYTALSLVVSEKNRFRVKLEGWDREWQDVGNRRQAFYNNLPARTYRFRVIASNNSGDWNETGAALNFTIAPAYYQTVWFRTLAVATFLSLLWAAHRIRLRVVERHQAEITALNESLMKAQEQERTRIAGELHDGVMQQISALSLMLGTGKRQAEADAKQTMADVQQKLIEVGTEVRQLSHNLHPPMLKDAGLPEALRGYCGEFSRVRNIPVSCHTDDRVQDLSRGAALAVYRIAQEAMGNAVTHGAAEHVDVRLTRSNGRVTLSVTDDGKGFDPNRIGGSGGLGLINMRERARQLNGTFELNSEPGRGTTVRVTIPFRPAV
jgi:signal transduction histidine kinase/ligand-binding sensor domain-containing protein